MKIGSIVRRLHSSFVASAGTIVFGMEDGTVSIFGLIFGVAATTTSTKTVLIAGASGAAAAAVSMMAGAYLDVETTRDETNAAGSSVAVGDRGSSLSNRLVTAGLSAEQSDALTAAVRSDRSASDGLLRVLQGPPQETPNPLEQAFWMLVADFFAAAVPILPFVLLPVGRARIVSGAVTLALLVGLGIGRAQIGKRHMLRTITETVSIGITAAIAGIAIGVFIDHLFSPGA